MSNLPHQIQRQLEIIVDDADMATYVKVPSLRSGRWTKVAMDDLIRVSAQRHQWRTEVRDTLKRLEGDDNE
jgi:hypothetical protein